MVDSTDRQKYITVIGANFLDFVVWDLVQQSYLTYIKTDFAKKRFQTSMWEHSHAAAAIVLSVIAIEAYRNRVYFLEKSRVTRKGVPHDLCQIVTKKSANFPSDTLLVLLNEIFVVRDVIVHNHIYEVEVFTDKEWTMIGHRQRLLKGYGFDTKYKSSVSTRTKKTNLLKLNVQPAKIGFEDIFKVLVATDLFIGVMQNVFGAGYVPFHVSHKIGDHHANNLSEILTHYHEQISRKSFLKFLEELATQLRNDFASFLPPYPHSDCFINNICPQCSKLGFDRLNDIHHCSKCGFRMGFIRNGVLSIGFTDKEIGAG